MAISERNENMYILMKVQIKKPQVNIPAALIKVSEHE
jgi:hypothetical protein